MKIFSKLYLNKYQLLRDVCQDYTYDTYSKMIFENINDNV